MQQSVNYLAIRALTLPFALLPYSVLHFLGKILGSAAFYLLPKFRKRALSNIALAKVASSKREIYAIGKASFQNLMTTCIEYPKFACEKRIERVAKCRNPDEADALMKRGKGVIFFCGHQANWEVLFLEGTHRMPGVAIGRPIKNKLLYDWVLKIREQYGGKIIPPRSAIKEGLRALKSGSFLGIVGDQGMPDSGYASPFFGVSAWTSPMAALLAYRTCTPIIVATTFRLNGKYWIDYSPPIWPNLEKPLQEEVDRMMRLCLSILEASIRERPGQWLWQHNRWKQQTVGKIKRRFRHNTLCVLMPDSREEFNSLLPLLATIRELYPRELLTLLIPHAFAETPLPYDAEIIYYHTPEQLLLDDLRFKLIFNFANHPGARRHYLGLSGFEVLTLAQLKKLAGPAPTLSETLIKAVSDAR